MKDLTTLSINKTTKTDYDKLRIKVNDVYNKKSSISTIFTQASFFSAIVNFLQTHEEDLIDFLLNPNDASWWEN